MNEIDTLEKLNDNQNAQALMRRTTDVAGVCKEIVLKTAVNIQGKKYIRCEGWQSIATAHGCIAGSRDVQKVEGGYKATGEIRRISDGVLLAQAEGFVGMDETGTWAKRPEYACRAMAQTRAISRVCRAAFAHVVVLMDAGLSTTPFEEVPDGGFDNSKPQSPSPKSTVNDSEASCEDMELVDFTVEGKKSAKGKAYTIWTAKFKTDSDSDFVAGTIQSKVGDCLDVLKGQLCSVKFKAGKYAGTYELLAIEPANDGLLM